MTDVIISGRMDADFDFHSVYKRAGPFCGFEKDVWVCNMLVLY